MTIIHISTAKGFRGGEQQAYYLIAELQRMGIKQLLIAPPREPLFQRVAALAVPTAPMGKRWKQPLEVMRYSKHLGPRVAHAHDSHAHTAVWLANMLGAQLPFVVSRRVARAPSTVRFSRGKYGHPQLRGLVCVSEAVAKLHQEVKGLNAPVHTVYSAIAPPSPSESTTSLRTELKLTTDTTVVGTVAALTPEKDYPTFVETCRLVAATRADVQFVVLGSGTPEQVAELKALVRQAGLEQRFHYLGFRDDVFAVLGQFDVFLFTSKWEGLGSSILQAFIRGIPVVATNAGGIGELVRDETGWLCEVGDSKQLAAGVEAALATTQAVEDRVMAAHQVALHHSLEEMAVQTKTIYEGVLSMY